VTDIHFYQFSDKVTECLLHGVQKRRKSILKTTRHGDIAKEVIYCYKCSIVRVMYPGYQGTPVMAQPQNPARDMPRLPGAVPKGFQYQDCRYLDSQHRHQYPSPVASQPPEKVPSPTEATR
jgi:hypothetical protein